MINIVLLVLAGVLTAGWGIAHIFPTRNVVKGFGPISEDNRNIVRMEWINEGITLVFIGVLILIVTFSGGRTGFVARIVYVLCALALCSMAVLSLFTGFRIKFLPFKLCPFIFGASALLTVFGAFL